MNRSFIVSALAFCLMFLAGCHPKEDPPPVKTLTAQASFIAETGEIVEAVYYADESVQLQLPDQTKADLQIAVSGSGSRYTNGSAEWWEHQGEATYRVNDEVLFSGKVQNLD